MALAKVFGEDEDIMEIDSPAQSLKRLLVEKAKTQTKGAANGKRTRDLTVTPTRTPVQVIEPSSTHQLKLWLGFEVMDKLATDQRLDELFIDETIADRVTRGILRKKLRNWRV